MDLALVWVFILAFAVYAYVVLDGFDLGVGILSPFVATSEERERMIGSIAPVWDGNETWLVLGGGGLMAAFPLAYAILMPAVYAPLIAMLLALIFRGVAFEFRHRDPRHRPVWTAGFVLGSYVAAFMQGIVLGTILQGVETAGRSYAGGWWDWLSPFSITTGLALVAGYALLGACWLLLKTSGDLQERMFRFARPLTLLVVAFVGVVSLCTPLMSPFVAERWFTWPNIALLAPVPLLVVGIAVALLAALGRRQERPPFLLALALFFLSLLGLGISFFPLIVPGAVPIWQAAAPDASLGFLLVGTAVLIPIILVYTAYSYWVFRGKVEDQHFYH